jgi:hypothetical protein
LAAKRDEISFIVRAKHLAEYRNSTLTESIAAIVNLMLSARRINSQDSAIFHRQTLMAGFVYTVGYETFQSFEQRKIFKSSISKSKRLK